LHCREVMIAGPYFDVALDAQRRDDGVGERHGYALRPQYG
jgi:hypothetical protein